MFDEFNNPKFIKKLNMSQLEQLASEIRTFLVESLSKTGGHLASNLGVVELTLALHKAFDIDKDDRIIWDVGHQCYTHKILTGRAGEFNTLRKFHGLSGFPKFQEDERDVFNTGHSSTSISAAVGIAKGKELKHEKGKAIAVIGDGAMTGGMAYEALNYAGHTTKNLIIVYNDNDMSISKNVGGFGRAMRRLRNANKYWKLKDDFKTALDNIPVVGTPTKKGIKKFKTDIKTIVLEGSSIFESMGYTYLGPVDGHDIGELIKIFNHAKTMDAPLFIHVKTKKGKGYKPAEAQPDKFHGIGSFDPKIGKPIVVSNKVSWSECFGEAICNIAAKNEKVVAVTAAMPLGTGLKKFSDRYGSRLFDVGIAEQHAATFSAGLARSGLVPVFAVYSTFLQRAYDQLLHDISLQNLHTVVVIDRSGPVGGDGETHQGVYDISFLSHMPNMYLISPVIDKDMEVALDFSVNKHKGPIAVRYPRGSALTEADFKDYEIPRLTTDNCLKSRVIAAESDADVLIVSVGVMLKNAVEAKEILEKSGYTVSLVDALCVKPIDELTIREAASGVKVIAAVENNAAIGGFGQMLECVLGRSVVKFAYPDEPVCQGTVKQIEQEYGLSPEQIAEKIKSYLR